MTAPQPGASGRHCGGRRREVSIIVAGLVSASRTGAMFPKDST